MTCFVKYVIAHHFSIQAQDQEIIRYFENPPWLEKILKIDDRKCPEKGRITVMC